MTSRNKNIIIGLQWGREGKARVMDFFGKRSDVVVRFQGCSVAGYFLEAEGGRIPVRYLPAGIDSEGRMCLITHGVTLDLERLSQEIAALEERGLLKAELTISPLCPLIMSYHKKMDVFDGRILGHSQNRTILDPGYGHCCADKFRRLGIRTGDLLYPDVLRKKLKKILSLKNAVFMKLYDEKPLDCGELYRECLKNGEKIKKYVGDTSLVIKRAAADGLSMLYEGCYGAMNDVDRGIYPHVMPSNINSANALDGPAMELELRGSARVIGVMKAYTALRFSGPLITEERGAVGAFIINRGGEYSEMTNEPARVGWLDLPALKYAIRENGVRYLAVTKLDVLTGIDELKICVGYITDGRKTDAFVPCETEILRSRPVYKTFKGWKEDLCSFDDYASLPEQAREYIHFIEEETGLPVIWIEAGSGPGGIYFRGDGKSPEIKGGINFCRPAAAGA